MHLEQQYNTGFSRLYGIKKLQKEYLFEKSFPTKKSGADKTIGDISITNCKTFYFQLIDYL